MGAEFDSTVSVFPGFMHVSFSCPYCGHRWEGVASVGHVGIECPSCREEKPDFVWTIDDDDPDKPDMPHDGAWLWGDALPQAYYAAQDSCSEEPAGVVVERPRPPWLIKIMAIIVGWWLTRQRSKE